MSIMPGRIRHRFRASTFCSVFDIAPSVPAERAPRRRRRWLDRVRDTVVYAIYICAVVSRERGVGIGCTPPTLFVCGYVTSGSVLTFRPGYQLSILLPMLAWNLQKLKFIGYVPEPIRTIGLSAGSAQSWYVIGTPLIRAILSAHSGFKCPRSTGWLLYSKDYSQGEWVDHLPGCAGRSATRGMVVLDASLAPSSVIISLLTPLPACWG